MRAALLALVVVGLGSAGGCGDDPTAPVCIERAETLVFEVGGPDGTADRPELEAFQGANPTAECEMLDSESLAGPGTPFGPVPHRRETWACVVTCP